MAESVLLGAAIGGGGAALTGNDPLKGAAIGGAMGGATAGFGGAGVTSGASAGATNGASHLAQTGAQQAASNAAAGSTFGQFSNGISDGVGQGFDYMNDLTGMENKDWTQMGLSQGAQLMQRDPQQPIQAAPMGQGISRPNVDLTKSAGSLLTSNPLLQEELRKRQGLL